MLIDGNSLTYRAFFALPTDLATASGQVTNAVFGFTSMLLNLVRDHRPDRVVVTFDLPQPTFRHERVETYKANRESRPRHPPPADGPGPPGGRHAGPAGRDRPGLRGRRRHRDPGRACGATPARTSSSSPATATATSWCATRTSGCSTTSVACRTTPSTTRPASLERTGVRPDQYVCYAALRGDPSDNLPGVPEGRREDRREAGQQLRRPRRHLRPHRRPDPRAAQEPRGARGPGSDERRDDAPGARRPARGRPTSSSSRASVDPDAVLELFRFLEFPTLVPRLAEAFPEQFGDGAGGRPARGAGARGRGHRARRRASEAAAALAALASAGLGRGGRRVGGPAGSQRARRVWRS